MPNARRQSAAAATRRLIMISMPLLVIQFLLGMYVNLYIPDPHHQPVLIAHIVVAIILVAAAAGGSVAALIARRTDHILVAGLGLAMLLLATATGTNFVAAHNNSRDSYLMAVGFILTMAIYGAGTGALRARAARANHNVRSLDTANG
jgi:hypothetical protein